MAILVPAKLNDVKSVTLLKTKSSTASFDLVSGNTLQLVFGGVAMNTSSDPVQIDAAGTTTVNVKGGYEFVCSSSGLKTAGGTATVWFRALINGTPQDEPLQQTFATNSESKTMREKFEFDLEVADTVTFEAVADSSNVDLSQHDPAPISGWTIASEAQSLMINRLKI